MNFRQVHWTASSLCERDTLIRNAVGLLLPSGLCPSSRCHTSSPRLGSVEAGY